MKHVLGLVALATLAGCSSFPVGQYAPSDANRELIARAVASKSVAVNDFTASKPNVKTISCRGAGHLAFPGGQSPEQYLAAALRKELTFAGASSADARIRISGNVNSFDFNSNIGMAGWDYDVTVSNGADNFRINLNYRVKTAWMAERACAAVAEQFVSATQEFTKQVLTHPKFVAWTAGGSASAEAAVK